MPASSTAEHQELEVAPAAPSTHATPPALDDAGDSEDASSAVDDLSVSRLSSQQSTVSRKRGKHDDLRRHERKELGPAVDKGPESDPWNASPQKKNESGEPSRDPRANDLFTEAGWEEPLALLGALDEANTNPAGREGYWSDESDRWTDTDSSDSDSSRGGNEEKKEHRGKESSRDRSDSAEISAWKSLSQGSSEQHRPFVQQKGQWMGTNVFEALGYSSTGEEIVPQGAEERKQERPEGSDGAQRGSGIVTPPQGVADGSDQKVSTHDIEGSPMKPSGLVQSRWEWISFVRKQLIHDLLDWYSEQGDVQTCIALAYVSSDVETAMATPERDEEPAPISTLLSEPRMERWLFSYVGRCPLSNLIVSSCGNPLVPNSRAASSASSIFRG